MKRFWIRKFRDEGARLTNFADGGEGTFDGKRHTEETKAKLRASALARGIKPPSRAGQVPWNKGSKGQLQPNSGTFHAGQAAWNKGKTMSPELVEKNRQGHVGKPWSAARRAAQLKKAMEG